jgi:general secretion pathway protein I
MLRHKGFSLLEILVAFGIMAVALTIVLRIFGSGVNTAINSEDYTIAVQIAESLMARTGSEIPLNVGEITGSEIDKYDWSIMIQPLATPAFALLPGANASHRINSQSATGQEENPLQMVSVKVLVSWGDDNERRRVLELKTIKLLVIQQS